MNHKTVCLPFPFLDENGGQLKLNAINLLRLPASESKDVIIERSAAVSTDIEGLEMFSNLFHYLFRTRAVFPNLAGASLGAIMRAVFVGGGTLFYPEIVEYGLELVLCGEACVGQITIDVPPFAEAAVVEQL